MKLKIVFMFLVFLSFLSMASAWADNKSIVQKINGCNTLNTTNAVYTLNQSINSSFSCLIINATNITLNCAGYNITYGNATGGWGIAVTDEEGVGQPGYNNVTIKNCSIIQNTSSSGVNESAIFFGQGSVNGNVYNNTIVVYGNETSGIVFEGDSVSANISLNNITTSGIKAHGIYLGEGGAVLILVAIELQLLEKIHQEL